MTIQLIPFTYLPYLTPPPHLVTTILFSVSICLFWFLLFINFLLFLYSTHAWSHMVFVFFWLISLSKVTSRCIHVVTNDKVHLFLVAVYSLLMEPHEQACWRMRLGREGTQSLSCPSPNPNMSASQVKPGCCQKFPKIFHLFVHEYWLHLKAIVYSLKCSSCVWDTKLMGLSEQFSLRLWGNLIHHCNKKNKIPRDKPT